MTGAYFEVTAGAVPGTGMAEYSRRWDYTAADLEKDRALPLDRETIFTTQLREAHVYAIGITNPARVKWVKVEWVWE
jgi:hypothetical protein